MKSFNFILIFILIQQTNAQATCSPTTQCCITTSPTPTVVDLHLFKGTAELLLTPTTAKIAASPTISIQETPTTITSTAVIVTETCSTSCTRVSSGTISDTASTSFTITTPIFVVQLSGPTIYINLSPTSLALNHPTLFTLGTTTAPSTSTDLRFNGVAWQAWSAWEYSSTLTLPFNVFNTFPWSTSSPTPTPSPALSNQNLYLAPSPSGLRIDLANCVTAAPGSSCNFAAYPAPSPGPTQYQSLGNDCIGLPKGYVYLVSATFVMIDLTNYHIDALRADDCGNINFGYTAPPGVGESGIINHNFVWSVPTSSVPAPSPSRYFFFRTWGSAPTPTTTVTAFGGLNKLYVRAIAKTN